jgi:hypothetical protein
MASLPDLSFGIRVAVVAFAVIAFAVIVFAVTAFAVLFIDTLDKP